jgi:hypothetical protein
MAEKLNEETNGKEVVVCHPGRTRQAVRRGDYTAPSGQGRTFVENAGNKQKVAVGDVGTSRKSRLKAKR